MAEFRIDPQNHIIFSKWREEKKIYLISLGFDVELVDCEPTDNSAKRIDFSSSKLTATICVWESGAIEFDAVRNSDDTLIFADWAPETMSIEEKLDYYLDKIVTA